jgi:succinyldiaminopimelate transaminase
MIPPDLGSFPWDALATHKAVAAAHPGGMVDLSVGSPVDAVPVAIRDALASAAELPGYPATRGTSELREAAVAALHLRHGVTGVGSDAVLPTVGSKELVAWLPTLLGVRPGQAVVVPELAYPTYEVGARLAGAETVRADGLLGIGPRTPAVVWVNSPSNPTGRVLPTAHLRKVVDWARERGAVVAADECYLSLGWEVEPVSVLHPSVSGGDPRGVLAVHSLSKSSNLAGYRAGLVAGDAALVGRLLAVRRQAGMIAPRPVQEAMRVALADDEHVALQRERYARRRSSLREALDAAGFRIDHSEAGLYLWATRGEPAEQTLGWLAERGILAAPGTFYGPSGERHVRISLTATDERIEAAVQRLGTG